MRGKVSIIQTGLTHFKKPFFEGLRKDLEEMGFTLQVVYGELNEQKTKKNKADLVWGEKIRNRSIRIFNTTFIWQNIFSYYKESDLIILLQENKLIANQLLLIFDKVSGNNKVALLGHGKNFQIIVNNSFKENVKKWFSKLPAWWFVYTELSRQVLLQNGVDKNIITVFNNSIDTSKLIYNLSSVSNYDIQQTKTKLGIPKSTKYIGVYSGSLYKEKRILFLLDSIKKLKKDIVDIEFIIVGDGPQRLDVEKFCMKNTYCHFVGFQSEKDIARYLKVSDFFLMPGAVGLAILDAFCTGIPIFTTDCGLHGPEIAYLKNNHNGFITKNNINKYTECISDNILNSDKLEKLKENSLNSASNYSIDKMISNFKSGIISFINKEIT